MDKTKYISLSQLGLYNPQRLDDETVESLFVVRQKYFQLLMDKINKEKPNSIPQHYLFIGQRGMGKSTLLKRIEVELRKKDSKFIPLLFPEEQYNLNNLSEFWLNSLDALADVLELVRMKEEVNLIDSKVKELGKIKNEDDLSKQAFQFLIEISNRIKKRPVLLIDNMSFIFDRLNKSDQHVLRAWLMQNDAPILIGASAVEIEDTFNYGAPFYDAFQISYLNKLSFDELLDILNNLAKLTNAQEILANIHEEIARLKTIHQLTGGNPRTAVMLFKIIVKGFSKEINDDLEALLDEITPLYKARFEELSVQMQIIVDAIALHWDPINLEQLRTETRLENNQLSPQLKRLVELGWLEKLDAYKAKGNAYQISERFFNIWFLMRRSSRRQKKELYCLSKFLETFYGDDLHEVAKNSLTMESKSLNHITFNLAMAEVVKDQKLKKQLKDKCHRDLRDEAKGNPGILKQFGLSEGNENDKRKIDFVKLEKIYLNKLKKNENDVETWFELGNLYQEDYFKKYQKSEQAYLEAIKLEPDVSSLWYNIGVLYQKKYFKEYEKAEQAYLKAVELDTNDAEVWFNLGNLYQEDYFKEYGKAEQAYLKAAELDINDAEVWFNLGNLYQEDYFKEYKKAEQAYLKAIELDEKDFLPWTALGILYQEDFFKEYEKAEHILLKAIELDEKKSFLWMILGSLYQNYLQEYEKAEKAYLKVIELDENDSLIWIKLGILYQEDSFKKYVKAEQAYLKAIELGEKDFLPWTALGILYQEDYFKEYEKAECAYLKAVELDGKNSLQWIRLGILYQENLQKYEKAEKAYLKAIELDKDDSYIWSNLGRLYMQNLQKYDEAEKAFLKAIEIKPNDSDIWNNLGNLYQDYLQKNEEAEKSYMKSIELDCNSQVAKNNLVFLYRDKMMKLGEAEELFNSLSLGIDVEDSYWLNKSLFELYKRNEGIAKENLERGLAKLDNGFLDNTQDDWWRYATVAIKLGYGNWFLSILEENSFDTILAPYYVAIKALTEKDSEGYLNSKAVEIREPARKIMEIMKKY